MQGLTSVLPSHWHHSCKSHAEMNVLFATRWCRLGVLWRFGCGQTLEHRPQPSGGTVHSSPQRPGLYCYDCEPLWKISSHSWQRGNTQDVGHTGRFFFFMSRTHALQIEQQWTTWMHTATTSLHDIWEQETEWQIQREWRTAVNKEPEGGTEIKRQAVVDSDERVNLDISIRSGMLFALKMTELSVILKPRQLARVQPDQSII